MSTVVVLNKHDGGMTNEPRDPRVDVYRNIQHFDNYTNAYKLTPYRSLKAHETPESTMDAFQIQRMLAANSTLYGCGHTPNAGANGFVINIYTLTAPGDPTSAWTNASGASSDGSHINVPDNILFVLYHNYLYASYTGNGGGIAKYGDITTGNSATFTYNDYTTHVATGQGLVHSADDILYFPSNNLVIYNNAGSYGVGLTLPANATISALCEFGNYLAIGVNLPNNKCAVYFWDRDTSLSTISEQIDWGIGTLQLIETVEGILCGVSTTANTGQSLTPRVLFKAYQYSYLSGSMGLNTVTIFQEFVCSLITIYAEKQRFNELFYFLAEMTLDGIAYKGLWKIYRKADGSMAISFDQQPMNGTALVPGGLYGFYRWGDYFFIAFENPSTSKFTVWRTDEQANYTATSVMDTCINPDMSPNDRIQKKKLISVGALYEPLPSGASVTVKYRVDGGSWLPIFTETTTRQVRTEPWTKAASAAFTDGFEYEFEVTSTGGGEVTAIIYKYDVMPSNS